MLQEGIFVERGTTPPPYFGILFLRLSPDLTVLEIDSSLRQLWEVYMDLKKGLVSDLPGVVTPSGNLNVSVGYSAKIFSLAGVKTNTPKPLQAHLSFKSVTQENTIFDGSALHYTTNAIDLNSALVTFQFLGDTPLVVSRPLLETWKKLQEIKRKTRQNGVEIVHFYTGFQREDRRSWIDFHDGVSNPKKGLERRNIVTIKKQDTSQEDQWTSGGSYMSFMRLPLKLEKWDSLDRQEQELLVGRDKVSGFAINRVIDGVPQPIKKCPFSSIIGMPSPEVGTVLEKGNEDFREPPDGVPDNIKTSHVQRANHHRKDVALPESLRIYRQGYDFIDGIYPDGSPKVGINFIAFHDTPFRIREMLTRPNWLGGINFGGSNNALSNLIEVESAAVFLLPPINQDEAFPGEKIFME